MLQSIQLMALPVAELKLRIAEELERNPSLEVIEDLSTVSFEEINSNTSSNEYDFFENSSDSGYTSAYDNDAADAKQKFLEGAVAIPESLHDHLMWQLRLIPLDEDEFSVGEQLVMNLDENGFHREPPEELIQGKKKKHLAKMIRLIQGLDPAGVCTKDYKESLLVQIMQDPEAPPYADLIVKDHLRKIEKETVRDLARELQTGEEEVRSAMEYIRHLTPFPGRLYDSAPPHYVIPDVSIKLEDGEFKIYLNNSDIPVLGISPFYADFQKQKGEKKKEDLQSARKFAMDYVREAEWFISSIHQRNRSLLKISKAIVEFQRDFFLKGAKYLVPLTLRDIAEEVSVHETTVSRISNAKYMQTEWGIYPIKYFFTNSISGAGSSGSRFSKVGVKEMVREILEGDTGEKRLSDQKISEILKEKGVSIARRTVAKYRKELDIDSSFDR
jgi:RNA polymerase sigma-54 factor